MITTEEISVRVYQLLQGSEVKSMISGSIDYERSDYSKEDVIIVPHAITGEDSVRFGEIKINIHVPDLMKKAKPNPVYKINFPRLIEIRAKVIEVLKSHYELGKGYNWTIGLLHPPIKEPDHNEHFVSFALEITVRSKKV
ncbi:hypothetical protein M2451_002558 [Dysgonomonas sp. PFB1-18]|uniref:hypothetical protein n=1 Tax=unclassified Dysgonomonas TaxID=2630389 RepID=UPI0024772462|nr:MULTISPECIES: hypothetical protein [unclassified Dysgonomonas]MDH6308039.1 hypothetical protein [Dysgonomonas sp. PF1-14]MDH6339578.1 hypothetical protein [Dysgonomonas sp. PF1-16]MDH6381229.1 hypothetical protein [Dysgonomonas sp. PFB1-18]MDH6398441.1 hypothetical protein [Dysgonomonas sp. PF1-23]